LQFNAIFDTAVAYSWLADGHSTGIALR
jgi:hypothetical protein